MKLLSFFIFLFFLTNSLFSQELISSQGDSYVSSSGSLDFSVGECIIETFDTGNLILTQGFHQSNLIVSDIKTYSEEFRISVRPNPVYNFLSVDVPDLDQVLKLEIYDLNSKLVSENKIQGPLTKIDFTKYSSGTYILRFLDHQNQLIKTIKIQKIK